MTASAPPTASRHRIRPVFLLLMAAALFGVGWFAQNRLGLDNFGVVEPGKIYRSGRLTARQLERVIRAYGIKTILHAQFNEFGKPEQQTIRTLCENNAVRLCPLQMEGDGRAGFDQYDRAQQVLNDSSHFPVLICCARGVYRTGTIVATYRILNQGWSREKALKEMRAFGMDKTNAPILEYLSRYLDERQAPPGK
ncbi:MAG: hypothetical protein HY343_01920 [Lentisphaerae bacterium]|nr:hypothetical protein [Lentisphaerota bacterium]